MSPEIVEGWAGVVIEGLSTVAGGGGVDVSSWRRDTDCSCDVIGSGEASPTETKSSDDDENPESRPGFELHSRSTNEQASKTLHCPPSCTGTTHSLVSMTTFVSTNMASCGWVRPRISSRGSTVEEENGEDGEEAEEEEEEEEEGEPYGLSMHTEPW